MFIVRHAKRADDSVDTDLSSEGIGRSIKLSKLSAGASVTTIFATQRIRTVQIASAARRGAAHRAHDRGLERRRRSDSAATSTTMLASAHARDLSSDHPVGLQ